MNSLFLGTTYYTKSIGAGLLAAAVIFVANSIMRKKAGPMTEPLLIPVGEEVMKTLVAVALSSSVVVVHLTVGLIEAGWEIRHRTSALIAALLAILSHAFFGAVTAGIWRATNNGYAGVSAAVLLHMFWNSFVYDLVKSPKKG